MAASIPSTANPETPLLSSPPIDTRPHPVPQPPPFQYPNYPPNPITVYSNTERVVLLVFFASMGFLVNAFFCLEPSRSFTWENTCDWTLIGLEIGCGILAFNDRNKKGLLVASIAMVVIGGVMGSYHDWYTFLGLVGGLGFLCLVQCLRWAAEQRNL